MPDPPRYTDRPLPPYRFVPGGAWPHPIKGEGGHMRDAPETEPILPPQRWAEQPSYLYAVDLFNHAYWWEAHEQWEGLWHLADRDVVQHQFLYGLIQMTAAMVKWHTHHYRGVIKLSRRARNRLAATAAALPSDTYMGLDLVELTRRLERAFAPFEAGPPDDDWPDLGEPLIIQLDLAGSA